MNSFWIMHLSTCAKQAKSFVLRLLSVYLIDFCYLPVLPQPQCYKIPLEMDSN